MKNVSHFFSKVEATIAAEALAERGIKVEIVGSRDYSSLVAGTDNGTFSLLVEDDRADEAEELLRSSKLNLVDDESIEVNPNSYFKKSVIYAFVGMAMVPLLGNFVSLRNLNFYLKSNVSAGKKIFVTAFVLLLQIPAILTLYFVLQKFSFKDLF